MQTVCKGYQQTTLAGRVNFICTDGTVGGNCYGKTESGCYDVNAGCRDNTCKCNDGFTDVDGTCTAGKSFLKILIA